jgi:spore germination cell wall hydrolase CwlJ-like protein
MDHEYRPTTNRGTPIPGRPRRSHPIFNALMATGFALLGYGALTGSANGPGVAVVPASLGVAAEDPIVTGSVDPFSTGVFSGPNRAEKRNRARPQVDVVAFAQDFETVRLQLAALRNPLEITEGPQSTPQVGPADPVEETPKISVAAVGPLLDSEALDAIDTAVPPAFDGPIPLSLSTKMAYARDNTPVTDFTIVRDENGKQVSEKELWCLATAIYFESRGEKYRGQIAVAQVVMNRLKHRIYPKTICGVVFQNQNRRNACQFSFACDGIPERVTDAKSWKQAEEIAEGVVRGTLYVPEVGNSTHYHATYVYPHWAPKMKKNTKIGLHVFYQFKSGWRFG